jgi:hypothetical protein
MITKTTQRAIIGSFLIIGTLLALYLTINVGYDLFCVHNTWMYRDGLIYKIGIAVLYADMPILFIAGLTSTISFFRKRHVWRPITKGIIINIILWLIYAGIMIGLLVWGFIYKIVGLLIIGSCIWLMLKIWKMIRI